MKLTKEILDSVRHIEGFPIGKDEDIIELSDPPHYTACPNPFMNDFIEKHGTPYNEEEDDYEVEPYAADVSEGKNDPIYNAHSYHTKVPHKAIMRYILHYTKPGDIVFDGFCGSGMTGVAAQMCGNPDLEFKMQIEQEMPGVQWGARKAILNDLSPAATFIAYNYNTPVNVQEFEKEAQRIVDEVEKECGWMYETSHVVNGQVQYDLDGKPVIGVINFVIWSDVFICSSCSDEIIFWEQAIDEDGKVMDKFRCQSCGTISQKNSLERAIEGLYDRVLCGTTYCVKQVPVLINYSVGGKRYEKRPDFKDFEILDRINSLTSSYWYPTDRLPKGYNTKQPIKSHKATHVHHFFTKRSLFILSAFAYNIKHQRNIFSWIITSVCEGGSKLNRERPNGLPSKLPGTLYISSMIREVNLIEFMKRKIKKRQEINFKKEESDDYIISTQSVCRLDNFMGNSIDYIFTDPPFGDNLMYSELNFIWEAWLKVKTNNKDEAIINNAQSKSLLEYQQLMEKSFNEYYRVLKPGRWMTMVFHNSKNSVWNAIQEAILKAGFVIANVRILDKKQGSFKQVTTTSAVKQDLVISAYKPKVSFLKRFLTEAGTEEGAWAFVREHLKKLPVVIENDGVLDIISERQNYLLYDAMIAFHIQKGASIPMGAADFYKGLKQRFPERDGMYFLPEQVHKYDEKRIKMEIGGQLSLFVFDEKTTIQWLYKELETPQTYQEIQPKFLRELHQVKHEKLPELKDILAENFLQNEKGQWYAPDLNKRSDLEKLREKNLLKEFEEYKSGKGKLKVFRTEAVRAGFKKCWREKDYKTIVAIGNRLPANVIQEDSSLLMYYDNASTRIGD
ncbi:MAG: DNA methyltransferase [Bacillota bacterium]